MTRDPEAGEVDLSVTQDSWGHSLRALGGQGCEDTGHSCILWRTTGDQLEGTRIFIRQKEQGERNEGALAEPGSQDRQPPPLARTPAGLIYSGPGSKDAKPGGFPLQKETGLHA